MTRSALSKNAALRGLQVLALAAPIMGCMISTAPLPAQPPQNASQPTVTGTRPKFEVASIKPTKPGSVEISLLTDPSGRFTTENATLRKIVMFGFDVKDFQVSGGPRWIDSDRFDIVARPEKRSNRAQVLQMVQTLLEDRFRLKFHRETKELPVFALVIAKNGPKLKPTKPEDDATRSSKGFQGGRGELTGLSANMGGLASRLSTLLGTIVIDRTGLTGKYDFKLQWAPDTMPPPRTPDEPVAEHPPGPSLLTAVQEQLGLRLETQKGPVTIIVIDSVERPSAN
jgi:uncharacterized protein (TIGR03435 family)